MSRTCRCDVDVKKMPVRSHKLHQTCAVFAEILMRLAIEAMLGIVSSVLPEAQQVIMLRHCSRPCAVQGRLMGSQTCRLRRPHRAGNPDAMLLHFCTESYSTEDTRSSEGQRLCTCVRVACKHCGGTLRCGDTCGGVQWQCADLLKGMHTAHTRAGLARTIELPG